MVPRMTADKRGQCSLPIRQYEVTLQSTQHVLASLLTQPVTVQLCFTRVVQSLFEQAAALRQIGAAYRIQRAYRRHRRRLELQAVEKDKQRASLAAALPKAPRQPLREAAATVPAPAKPLTRPPPPPLIRAINTTSGAAMNPIERRRLLVASQLAATNPNRLARSRRVAAARCQADKMPAVADATPPQSPRSLPASIDAQSWPDLHAGDDPTDEAGLDFREEARRSTERGAIASRRDALLESPRSKEIEPMSSLRAHSASSMWPTATVQANPRAPLLPPVNARTPRESAGDPWLKESLPDDDPLAFCMEGPSGISMAPPPPPPALRGGGRAAAAVPTSRGPSPDQLRGKAAHCFARQS